MIIIYCISSAVDVNVTMSCRIEAQLMDPIMLNKLL